MMATTAAALLACLLAAPVSGLYVEVHVESSLGFDEEAAKDRPVAKVTRLLKDMLIQMDKDAVTDRENYDKMACWCETNDKIKTKSIADGEARAADLASTIEALTATSKGLAIELENLKVEIADDVSALQKATSLNVKMIAEFNAEETSMLQTILQLGNAVKSMSKKLALTQMPRSHVDGIVATVKTALALGAKDGVLTHSDRSAMSAFIQGAKAPGGAYAPAGGQITGILKQMQETFETNLATTQKEESARQKSYFELKEAKESEIAAGNSQKGKKTQRLADTNENNAQAKQDLKDCNTILAADQDFLANLKERCTLNDKEWAERQASRITEVDAVNKALAVLTSDEARDMFSKSLGVDTSFVQTESSMNSERRARASKIVSDVAAKLQNPRLATLALKMRLDAFTKVKAAINKMVAELTTQNADEVKQNDFCIDELNRAEEMRLPKDHREITDDKSKLAVDQQLKKDLTNAITRLTADISTNNLEMKVAGEEREKQSSAFQVAVADQQATQALLKKALTVLQGVYKPTKTHAGKFIQDVVSAAPPPPKGFDAYKKNGAAGGVLAMLTQIIADSKQVEDEAVRDEQSASAAYISLVAQENAANAALQKDLNGKSARLARDNTALVEDGREKKADTKTLGVDETAVKDLHGSCDYVMKNFDVSQTARSEEKDALKEAMAILSGSKA